jgi:flagellar motility protein MotE (MotC chaperone)
MEIRALFQALDTSQTSYAARIHVDKSVLSRYLRGERIPQWPFVHDLLVHCMVKRDGGPPAPETVAHLRDPYRAAIDADGSPDRQIQSLRERLAELDARAQRMELELARARRGAQRARVHAARLEEKLREITHSVDLVNGESIDIPSMEEIARLNQYDPYSAACSLDNMNGTRASRALDLMNTEQAAKVLAERKSSRRSGILLNEMTPDRIVSILDCLDPSSAAQRLYGSLELIAEAFSMMTPERAAKILNHVDWSHTYHYLARIDPVRTGEILALMTPAAVARLVKYFPENLKIANPEFYTKLQDLTEEQALLAARSNPAMTDGKPWDPGT